MMMPTDKIRVVRLERLWNDGRPICDHAFSLIVDGRMVQDDAVCGCGGERITVIAVAGDNTTAANDNLRDDITTTALRAKTR